MCMNESILEFPYDFSQTPKSSFLVVLLCIFIRMSEQNSIQIVLILPFGKYFEKSLKLEMY